MAVLCKFCSAPADFRYSKEATKESPESYPPTDICYECYDQHIGIYPDGMTPEEIKEMAFQKLREN